MRVNQPSRPGARPPAGLQLKTGYRVGLAGPASSNTPGDFGPRPLPGGAGLVIDPTPLIDLSQRFLEWLEDWAADYRLRQLTRAGKIIDLPDLSRYYELDAARGVAIVMMLLKHGLDGWGRLLSPSLVRLLLSLWTPGKVFFMGGIAAFFFSAALLESQLFQQVLDQISPGMLPGGKVALAWALAAVPAVFISLQGVGAAAFLVLSGMTMAVRARRQSDRQKLRAQFTSQGLQLLAAGLLVTILSLLLVPGKPIYFGILQLLGLASILAEPLLALPLPVLAVSGLLISLAGVLMPFHLPVWLGLGFVPVAMSFADYTPLLPFLGPLLLGLAVGLTLYPDGRTRKYRLPDLSRLPLVRALAALGRHSLLIYLAQQPINLAGMASAGA